MTLRDYYLDYCFTEGPRGLKLSSWEIVWKKHHISDQFFRSLLGIRSCSVPHHFTWWPPSLLCQDNTGIPEWLCTEEKHGILGQRELCDAIFEVLSYVHVGRDWEMFFGNLHYKRQASVWHATTGWLVTGTRSTPTRARRVLGESQQLTAPVSVLLSIWIHEGAFTNLW